MNLRGGLHGLEHVPRNRSEEETPFHHLPGMEGEREREREREMGGGGGGGGMGKKRKRVGGGVLINLRKIKKKELV